MASSLHLRWMGFFPVTGVLKQLYNKWQSICFLNLRNAIGFVGNSYKFVNTAIELLRAFCFVLVLFFPWKNHPSKWACSYSLTGARSSHRPSKQLCRTTEWQEIGKQPWVCYLFQLCLRSRWLGWQILLLWNERYRVFGPSMAAA